MYFLFFPFVFFLTLAVRRESPRGPANGEQPVQGCRALSVWGEFAKTSERYVMSKTTREGQAIMV